MRLKINGDSQALIHERIAIHENCPDADQDQHCGRVVGSLVPGGGSKTLGGPQNSGLNHTK